MKKYFILLLSLLFVFPIFSYPFSLRYKNDVFLGLIGGYNFPQVASASKPNGSHFSFSGKEYHFGLSLGYFTSDNNAVSMSFSYQYFRINKKDIGMAEERFLHINLIDEYYLLDYVFLAMGGYITIPFKTGTYTETINPYAKLTGGLVAQAGVNMRIWEPFSLRIALQVKIPFNPIFTKKQNNIFMYSAPIGLIFSLEYTI